MWDKAKCPKYINLFTPYLRGFLEIRNQGHKSMKPQLVIHGPQEEEEKEEKAALPTPSAPYT